MSPKPIVGITMGDPAGVGPEVIVKALQDAEVYNELRPLVLGDPGVMEEACRRYGQSQEVRRADPEEDAIVSEPGLIQVLALSQLSAEEAMPGRPGLPGGRAALKYIESTVRLVHQGWISAVATAPVNKDALKAAGCPFPGHTELLAALTGTKDFAMMLAGERLKVVLATIHCALKEVPELITTNLIATKVMLVNRELSWMLGMSPRIAVAGLNPHAGEAGQFGREEIEIIAPAVAQCRDLGAEVTGPHPPDVVFREAAAGKYDVVIAMYHDQGLIPLKLIHFEDGVNVTLGLPFIRTSVDHGTAYDIAGQGKACADSMKSALKWAARLCLRKPNES